MRGNRHSHSGVPTPQEEVRLANKTDKGYKRILVISDTHCGSCVGLTHPKWQLHPDNFVELRAMLWDWYCNKIDLYKPYDVLIFNGDAIDGKSEKVGGTDIIESDRTVQVEMAVECIKQANPKQVHVIAGTPYHTGVDEDWEKLIAQKVDGQFHSKGYFNVYGVELNFKHFISDSSIPHGRLTPLAKEILWNRQWYLEGVEPKARILVRSHVHHFEQIEHDDCLGFITPSLQGLGTKYGSRRCSGIIHFGFIVFNIYDNGEITWKCEKIEGKTQKAQSIIL